MSLYSNAKYSGERFVFRKRVGEQGKLAEGTLGGVLYIRRDPVQSGKRGQLEEQSVGTAGDSMHPLQRFQCNRDGALCGGVAQLATFPKWRCANAALPYAYMRERYEGRMPTDLQ